MVRSSAFTLSSGFVPLVRANGGDALVLFTCGPTVCAAHQHFDSARAADGTRAGLPSSRIECPRYTGHRNSEPRQRNLHAQPYRNYSSCSRSIRWQKFRVRPTSVERLSTSSLCATSHERQKQALLEYAICRNARRSTSQLPLDLRAW
jgi:hypothetical protein